MNHEPRSPRANLIREAAILQIKLIADGFRDALLIPVSLFAAFMGLLRGGEEADREFRRVIKLGRRSKRWLPLFGKQRPLGRPHPADSIDTVLGQVESTLVKQYKRKAAENKGHSEQQDSDKA